MTGESWMTPYYDDGQVRFLLGDVRDALRELPDESVQCVVTSPPYWSLRDYGVPPSVWGERDDVDGCPPHAWGDDTRSNAWGTAICSRCSAWRGVLGMEPTPDLYVLNMVEVFREVRRVLRSDGTVWLNLGDCYATGAGKVGTSPGGGAQGERWARGLGPMTQPNRMPIPGLKPKDLIGIPWRVAFALQADGWYLRSDIIWAKPNPMPESVTDRPTKAHEYIFLLSKSARYYFDREPIREPVKPTSGKINGAPLRGAHVLKEGSRRTAKREYDVIKGANRRSVWTVSTKPFPGAHFATFPPALVTPCILAGAPEGAVVLDPFIGSGTTAVVAKSLGRRAIGIDLNPEYLDMAIERCRQLAFLTHGDVEFAAEGVS